MFNNLIESSSHRREYKRRGTFLLFTTATYVVLFVITGIVSIYAYDAHLESQSTELELLTFIPLPTAEPVTEVPRNTIRNTTEIPGEPSRSTRTALVDSADNPNNPPREVGTVASSVPPARSDSVIGPTNADPATPPANVRGTGSGSGVPATVVGDVEPPPQPTPAPEKKILRVSKVLNSEALSLPKPNYPPLARQIHIQGMVSVQVLIDETGKVLTAKASGHPLLVAEAQRVALQARFSPTTINGQPVKISGVITYNFILNQ